MPWFFSKYDVQKTENILLVDVMDKWESVIAYKYHFRSPRWFDE